jgi:tetratricopeptide (TPR) repeat protein|tara:strand:- start:49474 stop:51687 length:2214 start_codon:yes stop_codon:yes gene_type:complete
VSSKDNVVIQSHKIIFFLLVLIYSCQTDTGHVTNYVQEDPAASKFVGSMTCLSCHKEQYSSWKDSHHDQAMKIADSSSVLADFNDALFTSNNIKSTFFKKGNDYFVNTKGEDGNYHDYKIDYTFGVTPLQQYIVQFPNGKYQCLQTAWDTEQNKWFDLQPDIDDIEVGEWIHWTGGGMRWNSTCADCHSTNLHKNFDSKSNSYNTTFSEINVGCEACHGPASLHVDYYKNPNKTTEPPPMYMANSLSFTELVDKCARCHSLRKQITKAFDYKGQFLDHYYPTLLVDPVYELDGQIRGEDYVYGSFIQSKMYHNGVSCKDCHDVHSLKLKQSGNALCLSCHDQKYDKDSHHFHDENSKAAQCINCHMIGKTYMGNDFRRDHSFRIPRPDQTIKYSTPNACNNCHSTKSPKWASDFINSKYGTERANHFSDLLLAGSHGDNDAYYTLISQRNYPDIARATALNLYANQQLFPQELTAIKEFLKDSSANVRNEAIHAFEKAGGSDFYQFIAPLLLDSIRTVRISAARYFNAFNLTPLNLAMAESELLEELEMNADFASGQHQIAVHHQKKGNIKLAIKAYKRAIKLDSYHNISRLNLALLIYQQGDVSEAEKLYLKVIEQEPDYSYSYFMLGLLYHEIGNSSEALKYFGMACEKEPVNIRAFYNYALKLQEAGQNEESIRIIDRALTIIPDNEEFLYVKLIGQLNDNQHNASYNTCLKLLEIAPNNVNYKQIWDRLKQNM